MLVEHAGVGTSEDYLKVRVRDCPAPEGSVVDVMLAGIGVDDTIVGQPVEPAPRMSSKGDDQ